MISPPLGTAKWHVNNGALVGHQCRQGLDFILVDDGCVPDTALGWQAVIAVGGAPASEDLDTTADFNGKRHLDHALADFQSIANARIEIHDLDGMVDHVLDAFPKAHALLGKFGITHGCPFIGPAKTLKATDKHVKFSFRANALSLYPKICRY